MNTADLDKIPLGSAEEERARAQLWMETAAQYARNAEYWRDQRAYPAEELVRILHKGFKAAIIPGSSLQKLITRVEAWGRPENPARFTQFGDNPPVDPSGMSGDELRACTAQK